MEIKRKIFTRENIYCGIFKLEKHNEEFVWKWQYPTKPFNENIEKLVGDFSPFRSILPFYEDHLWRS